MTDPVIVENSGGVLTLTLNRPDKKNALTTAMYEVLTRALDDAAEDASVGCVLIQGNGDSFSAGNDLAEFAAINAGDRERVIGNSLVSALARNTVPNRPKRARRSRRSARNGRRISPASAESGAPPRDNRVACRR